MNYHTLSADRELWKKRHKIIGAVMTCQQVRQPSLLDRCAEFTQIQQCVIDTIAHLRVALLLKCPVLFDHYITWLQQYLTVRDYPPETIGISLDCLEEAISVYVPTEVTRAITPYLESAGHQPAERSLPISPLADSNTPLASLARQYLKLLLQADLASAYREIEQAMIAGIDFKELYLEVFQPAQIETGRLWLVNQISVAMEHYCTAATHLILSRLSPTLFLTTKRNHTVVATCVQDELHETGIRMVTDFLAMDGWNTYYIGANSPTATIIQALTERNAQLIAVSTTLTSNLTHLAQLIDTIHETPACAEVKILVGGYTFNIAPNLWQHLGADGYAPDARQAVHIAECLLA